MLNLAGAIESREKVTDGKWKITLKSVEQLGTAYSALYDNLAASNKVTTQELNELAAKIAKNQMSKQ